MQCVVQCLIHFRDSQVQPFDLTPNLIWISVSCDMPLDEADVFGMQMTRLRKVKVAVTELFR